MSGFFRVSIFYNEIYSCNSCENDEKEDLSLEDDDW